MVIALAAPLYLLNFEAVKRSDHHLYGGKQYEVIMDSHVFLCFSQLVRPR